MELWRRRETATPGPMRTSDHGGNGLYLRTATVRSLAAKRAIHPKIRRIEVVERYSECERARERHPKKQSEGTNMYSRSQLG